jgi:CRISPR/Cas system-associated endonuclease Cas1
MPSLYSSLIAAGLTPAIGIYHEQREGMGWYPLAADLQEEVRHLADRVVLTLIRKGQVVPSQFTTTAEGHCVMDGAARRSVLEEMKRRLAVTFTPEEGVTLTWKEGIARQAQQIRELVTGRRERYVPLESPK